MSVFAVLALTLSALGIYGVLSYSVSQRRQELSVRMALGAERGAIVWLVIRQGVVLAAAGLTIGAAGGYALGRLLSGLLFGVTPPISRRSQPSSQRWRSSPSSPVPSRRGARRQPICSALFGENSDDAPKQERPRSVYSVSPPELVVACRS